MYETVRKNDPKGIIIMGGAQQYALDSASLIAFYLQYNEEEGSYPTNLIFNEHPYQGGGQALEHSLQSIMRLSISLQTLGPVIFTECYVEDNYTVYPFIFLFFCLVIMYTKI